jgi:hypothetical protein
LRRSVSIIPTDFLSISLIVKRILSLLFCGTDDSTTESFRPGMCEEKAKEDWIRLSELAAVEKDPERLRKLIEQIIHLIDSRQKTEAPAVRKKSADDDSPS